MRIKIFCLIERYGNLGGEDKKKKKTDNLH